MWLNLTLVNCNDFVIEIKILKVWRKRSSHEPPWQLYLAWPGPPVPRYKFRLTLRTIINHFLCSCYVIPNEMYFSIILWLFYAVLRHTDPLTLQKIHFSTRVNHWMDQKSGLILHFLNSKLLYISWTQNLFSSLIFGHSNYFCVMKKVFFNIHNGLFCRIGLQNWQLYRKIKIFRLFDSTCTLTFVVLK